MPTFYLNIQAQANGNHEVHKEDCTFLPRLENRIFLGDFNFCSDAIVAAKEEYQISKLNGCYFCAKGCHTR